MKDMPAYVFRAYDIRGLVDIDFTEETVYRLGLTIGTFFHKRSQQVCALGRDCRESSIVYRQAMIEGLLATGADVIDVGMVPSPLLYYAVKHLNLQAGVMITASHNPSEYNGFKIWSGASTLHSEEVQALREIMVSGDFHQGRGVVSELNVVPAYMQDVCSRVSLARPVKVVLDGGNGAGGEYCLALLRALGAEVIPIFCEPDGRFPNHHPDPVVEENMAALQAKVLECGAELGIGLDGDADRIGVVDEKGRLLYGDELLALYSRELLARIPGACIIGDVKCSHRLFRDIEAHGGKAEMYRTGHSIIKARMLEKNAALAGEMSGHMFFADRWYGFDDALYASARLLEIMARSATPLSQQLGWPPSCVTPEIHVDCPDSVKFSVIQQAREFFRRQYETIEIDGVRLVFPDGWALVRASNTQPVLVLRFEAESPERLARIRALVEEPLAAWVRAAQARA